MIKLLHTADWQIGRTPTAFEPDDAALLAEARFSTVEGLARLATAEAVQAVLVAGDVFDAQGVADKTLHRLFNALAGFAGPWLLLPGNHDAALAESVWTRAQRLGAVPPNVHLCLRPEPLLLPDHRLAVLPAPLLQRHTHHDLTAWFDTAATPSGWHRVGLAHGGVQGLLAEGAADSNPIAARRAEQAGLCYLALGDWHGTRQIDARTWYSGTPETDRFKANASGQALLVTLPEPGELPAVRPVATGQYRWLQEAVHLQVPSDLQALLQRLAAVTASEVLQLQVAGRVDLAQQQQLHAALGPARARARALLVDLQALQLVPTADDLAALHADGYLGEVLAELQAAQALPSEDGGPQASAQVEVARDALAVLASLLVGQAAAKAVGRAAERQAGPA